MYCSGVVQVSNLGAQQCSVSSESSHPSAAVHWFNYTPTNHLYLNCEQQTIRAGFIQRGWKGGRHQSHHRLWLVCFMCLCSGSPDGKHPAKVLLLCCHFGSCSAMNKDLIGAAALSDTGCVPRGICRQPHFLLLALAGPTLCHVLQQRGGECQTCLRAGKPGLGVCLCLLLQTCQGCDLCCSAGPGKVECRAVAPGTALDSRQSEGFPFVPERNVFWCKQT